MTRSHVSVRVCELLLTAWLWPGAAPLRAQESCGSALRVTTTPDRPRRGTLFIVQVTGNTDAQRLTGNVNGEALHFHQLASGAFRSFAPAPIDSAAITVEVHCSAIAAADTIRRRVTFVPGSYRIEHLRVAPRFSEPPDSALAARQAREAAQAAQVSRDAHHTPRLWSAPFVAPRPSRITSPYGGGREFNGTVTSRHMGTDYAGAVGAPIRAANRGVVRLVDDFFLGGKVVYVDHGEGLVSAYLHMSAHRVTAGDTVERGSILGLVGASGRVTGPHLHFIVRYGTSTVDPQSVMGLTRTDSATRMPGKRR